MKLIVGLGNPKPEYDGTRHNVGFRVLDVLSETLNTKITKSEKRALTGTAMYEGEKLMLVKPQTFMNLSGESVRPLADYYHVDISDILIICDDINLEIGQLRMRAKGSAGGHNGLKSIIQNMGSDEFSRLRVGVGGNDKASLVDFVLGHFTKAEQPDIDKAVSLAAEAALCFAKNDIETAMNKYNGLWRAKDNA